LADKNKVRWPCQAESEKVSMQASKPMLPDLDKGGFRNANDSLVKRRL